MDRLGFKQDPPNAALAIGDAPKSKDVLVLELSRPRLERGGGSVKFRAKVVKGSATGALAKFRKRADRRVDDEFGPASLFIDPGVAAVGLTFTIYSPQFSSPWGIRLSNATLEPNTTVRYGSGPATIGVAAIGLSFTGDSVGATVDVEALPMAGATAITGTVQSLTQTTTASVLNSATHKTTQLPPTGPFSIPLD